VFLGVARGYFVLLRICGGVLRGARAIGRISFGCASVGAAARAVSARGYWDVANAIVSRDISGAMMIQATVPSAFGILLLPWLFNRDLLLAGVATTGAVIALSHAEASAPHPRPD
jgi:hypothetical protein